MDDKIRQMMSQQGAPNAQVQTITAQQHRDMELQQAKTNRMQAETQLQQIKNAYANRYSSMLSQIAMGMVIEGAKDGKTPDVDAILENASKAVEKIRAVVDRSFKELEENAPIPEQLTKDIEELDASLLSLNSDIIMPA